MPRRHLLILLCVVVSWSAMACAPQRVGLSAARPFQFVTYGDMPYGVTMPDGRSDAQVLADDIAPEIRRREDLPFVIHVGDLGRPEDVCTDVQLESSKRFWATAWRQPVFYTPGDNDWTDCDRPEVPVRTSELARLAAVRRIFFSPPPVLAPSWHYVTQPAQPENALWWYAGVLFVTVHMVGTDNGRTGILRDNEEHARALATQREAAAVVIATQVDPFGPPQGHMDALSRCLHQPAYAAFCEQIFHLSATLGKPVLLIHGDTNAYCLDQPFPPEQAPRLWRLNAPGDFDVIDAAVVSINPARSSSPFAVTGLLSGQAAPQECHYRQR